MPILLAAASVLLFAHSSEATGAETLRRLLLRERERVAARSAVETLDGRPAPAAAPDSVHNIESGSALRAGRSSRLSAAARSLQQLPEECNAKTRGTPVNASEGMVVLGSPRTAPGAAPLPPDTTCIWQWYIPEGFVLETTWAWIDLSADPNCTRTLPLGAFAAMRGFPEEGGQRTLEWCHVVPEQFPVPSQGVYTDDSQTDDTRTGTDDVWDNDENVVRDDEPTSDDEYQVPSYPPWPRRVQAQHDGDRRVNWTKALTLSVYAPVDAYGLQFSWRTFTPAPAPANASAPPAPASSATPTMTRSASASASASVSASAQSPGNASIAASASMSASASTTLTASSTQTVSARGIPMLTETATQTAAPQGSPSATMTRTRTATMSLSRTASATASKVPALSPSASSSASPSSSLPPAPPAPPSDDATASVSVVGPMAWSLEPNLLKLAREALQDVLGIQQYRLTTFVLHPRQGSVPPRITFDVIAAVGGAASGEPSPLQLVTRISQQLAQRGSTLRTNTVFAHAAVAPVAVLWATAAGVSLSPTSITLSVSAGSVTPSAVSIQVSNPGGSVLEITDAHLVVVSSQYANPFQLNLLVSFPIMVNPGGVVNLARLNNAVVPRNDYTNPVLAMINVQHNVPSGAHAVPVLLTFPAAPSPSTGIAAVFDSPAFGVGAGVGAGGVLFALICLCVCYCRYCRKKPAPASSTTGISSSPNPRAQQSFLAFMFGWGSGSARPAAGSSAAAQVSAAARAVQRIDLSDSDDERANEGTALSAAKPRSTDTRALPFQDGAAGSSGRAIEMTSLSSANVPAASAAAPPDAPSSSSTTITSGITTSAPRPSAELRLKLRPVMKASEFEAKWASLGSVEVLGATLRSAPADGELERTLAPAGILCLASGVVSGVSKYYFYAQEADTDRLCMAEVSITLASLRLSVVAKAADPASAAPFLATFKRTIAGLLQE